MLALEIGVDTLTVGAATAEVLLESVSGKLINIENAGHAFSRRFAACFALLRRTSSTQREERQLEILSSDANESGGGES